jgi:hypothetical protein
MSLLSNPVSLWWVTITATTAAVVTFVGAFRGATAHRMPRVMLAIAVSVMAASYWWDLAGSSLGAGSEMRRGAAMVMWPALLWTAWSGVAYSRRRDAVVAEMLGGDGE